MINNRVIEILCDSLKQTASSNLLKLENFIDLFSDIYLLVELDLHVVLEVIDVLGCGEG